MTLAEVDIAVAWIGATASLVVSVVGALVAARASRRSDEALERVKADIAARSSEADARRDYRYKAKQRLYEECEPILFQLLERADDARHRIASLARTARQGRLDPGLPTSDNWLAHEGYYLASTTYYVFAPLVIGALLRRKITLVDLTVSPRLARQYVVAKEASNAITDAFRFAAMTPALDYAPAWGLDEEADRDAIASPVSYPQGLVAGDLERLVEAMTIDEGTGARCMTYAEFEACLMGPSNRRIRGRARAAPAASTASASMHRAAALRMGADLFLGFHPARRPVLWRVLLGQAQLYDALWSLRSRPDDPSLDAERLESAVPNGASGLPEDLRWTDDRHSADQIASERAGFAAAHTHVVERLSRARVLEVLPADGA